jgi:dihydrofolate synthase / folylpolyglutamate synthase
MPDLVDVEYQRTLDYLYGFVDYSLTRNFQFTPDKFNLARIEHLLERLGSPHKKYQVVHVAGTKGKGSISALIASALRSAGHRTGFYTSPHLSDFNERIMVDGVPISHTELVDLVNEIKKDVAQVPELTTFEITTALAFLYFARRGVEVAVIEVGLGGRLDATNVVQPLVSVISSLSYDHMNVLGSSLTQIAAEKAGIIKHNAPVVLAPQAKEEARAVIARIAGEHEVKLVEVGRDYHYAHRQHSLDSQSFLIWSSEDQHRMAQYLSGETGGWQPLSFEIPLLGYHQIENAASAYAALEVLRTSGVRIGVEDIRRGFREVFWPGRFEVLRKEPPVIVDSAHNRDSALRLRLALDDYLGQRPVLLLFGASEDKDVTGMFAELMPRINRVIVTQSTHPRAMETSVLLNTAWQFGCQAESVLPLDKALQRALQMAGNEMAVVAAGSLFISASIRETWSDMGYPLRRY